MNAHLEKLLAQAKTTLRRRVVLEGGLMALTALPATFLLGVFVSWLKAPESTTAVVQIVVATVLIGFLLVRYVALWRGLHSREAVAAWLDAAIHKRVPGRNNLLLSAVELERDRGRYPESTALTDAAVQNAWREVEQLGDVASANASANAIADATPGASAGSAATSDGGTSVNRLIRAELRPSLRRHGLQAFGALALTSAVLLFSPKLAHRALLSFSSLTSLETALRNLPPDPRIGDLRLTYRFPAYTERPERVVEHASGEIYALPGTEVIIEAKARHEVSQATLLVSHGGEEGEATEPTRTAVQVDGRRMRTSIVVVRSGRYRFRVTTTEGELQEERDGHEIVLESDEPPMVSLVEPADSPLEVNERDRITVVFEANDDFGLAEAAVAWQVLGTERAGRLLLSSNLRGSKHHSDSAQINLAELRLTPGDRVAYTVEVSDNDSVTGPKVGSSATKELRVYSKKEHHREVLALQALALDELVHVLGDNLENALSAVEDSAAHSHVIAAAHKILARAANADELLRKAVAAVRKDPLGRREVANAFEEARTRLLRDVVRKRDQVRQSQRALEAKKKVNLSLARSVERSQRTMIQGLEQNVVYLADLLNDQRMIDAESLLKELRAQQQQLREALEAYKNAPTEEQRRMIESSIREIRKRIREIMTELGKVQGGIPQDFVNPDALDAKDDLAMLDEMERRLEEGDLSGSMDQLDRMLAQTEKMISELQAGRHELGHREYSEIAERAQQIGQDLEELQEKQRRLAEQTEKISKNVLERMKERLKDPDAFVEQQLKRLKSAKANLERARPNTAFSTENEEFDKADRRVDDASQAIETRDFGAAKEMLDEAVDTVKRLEQEAGRKKEYARRFGDFLGSEESAERSEEELRRTLPILEEVLRDIEGLMPPPNDMLRPEERKVLEHFEQQQRRLGERAKRLNDDLDELGKQLPIVGPEVGQTLEEARQAMGQAEASLRGGDAPSALSQERRALEALRQLAQELEKSGQKGSSSGGPGVPLPFGQSEGASDEGDGQDVRSQEKVQIPQPEQYKAPSEFREDILEAAKQGTVEAFKDAVREYYEELVK